MKLIFGRYPNVNGWQLIPRVIVMLGVMMLAGLAIKTAPFDHGDQCYLICGPTAAEVAHAQGQPTATKSVAVYGDSRAYFLAGGLNLVPGWRSKNLARQGCAFLGQDHIWKKYTQDDPVGERTVSTQLDGSTVTCDTRTYITGTGPVADLAIVYAGTLLAVDNGEWPTLLTAPTDRSWAGHLEVNLTATLSRIHAKRIVIVGTPASHWGDKAAFWNDPARLDATDAILARVAAATGATWLPGFADWVEAQPASCQPDGAHFTNACAAQAGAWIKAHLA